MAQQTPCIELKDHDADDGDDNDHNDDDDDDDAEGGSPRDPPSRSAKKASENLDKVPRILQVVIEGPGSGGPGRNACVMSCHACAMLEHKFTRLVYVSIIVDYYR